MRVEFTNTVHKIMQSDKTALFLTGDLGFNAFEGLMKSFGSRFVNMGAAEQNMIGVAAGMAFEGFRPWCYSIAPFVTYRCMEQIRNDVCLHNLPVHLAGNGGGYTYGIMGSTHHTLEDMAVLKALPNMQLYFPCTNNHVESAVMQIAQTERPTYLRLGFSGYPSNATPIRENPVTLTRTYSEGKKATLIGVGQGTQVILNAIDENLISKDSVAVYGLAKFPLDLESDANVVESCLQTQNVIVVEEHYLYGSIAESLKMALPNVKRFQTVVPNYFPTQTYGSPKFQLKQTGMTPQKIAELLS